MAAISVLSTPWVLSGAVAVRVPSASLVISTGSRSCCSVSLNTANNTSARSGLLRCSFLPSSSLSCSSSFSGEELFCIDSCSLEILHYYVLICLFTGVCISSLMYLFALMCVCHFLGPYISNCMHARSFDLVISLLFDGVIFGWLILACIAFDYFPFCAFQ